MSQTPISDNHAAREQASAQGAATASQELARFAAGLRFEDIPADVQERAAACIADTLGCVVYGARFPWSVATAAYARRYGGQGACTVFGTAGPGIAAPQAALANGASAHAFEQDSLRYPGAGVHPGATLVPVVAAVCQETGADGRRALTAFVAGCEVLFRIGAASRHTSEKLGFHAPGLTGPYGAAVVAGVLLGLDATGIARALGIAGSLSAGLLAFTKSREGAMVKRLHMGRACEAGILAARLAAEGYSGPETILEGRFGFLDTYCRDGDAGRLTAGLGSEWETLRVCMKRYACHVTPQAAMQTLRELMATHGFAGGDVASLALGMSEKVASHHDIRQPGDIMTAQYSVPFCVALALYRDPEDPRAFDESALQDAAIADLCRRIDLTAAPDLPSAWSARIVLTLRDGRRFEALARDYKGMPQTPMSGADLRRRFLLLTEEALGTRAAADWYEKLMRLPAEPALPLP
ncbi:MAG TPA: MmgE/PrpD family protein [Bordetella sp.]|nr:MmgE/PrpD family protein [Bordetella sp.]